MILNIFKLLIIISLVISIFGCNQDKKRTLIEKVNGCIGENKDKIFENNFYPFIKSEYLTSNMIKYFIQGVKIDSIINNNNGDTILLFKYYDNSSQIIFSLDRNSQGKYNFYIGEMEIKSNLIKFKNGIGYNMTKKDFFNVINYKELDCDTFKIHEASNLYYLRFIFNNDKLKSISIENIEL